MCWATPKTSVVSEPISCWRADPEKNLEKLLADGNSGGVRKVPVGHGVLSAPLAAEHFGPRLIVAHGGKFPQGEPDEFWIGHNDTSVRIHMVRCFDAESNQNISIS